MRWYIPGTHRSDMLAAECQHRSFDVFLVGGCDLLEGLSPRLNLTDVPYELRTAMEFLEFLEVLGIFGALGILRVLGNFIY
jgi:hypothetical protein